jgi:hypothetical protein
MEKECELRPEVEEAYQQVAKERLNSVIEKYGIERIGTCGMDLRTAGGKMRLAHFIELANT